MPQLNTDLHWLLTRPGLIHGVDEDVVEGDRKVCDKCNNIFVMLLSREPKKGTGLQAPAPGTLRYNKLPATEFSMFKK